jgi:hypothetical protein
MPGLVKIGQTANDPTLRAAELCTTGVPGPFKLEYKGRFAAYAALERRVHRQLSKCRHIGSREFFSVSVEDAISLIRDLSSSSAIEEHVFYLSTAELRAATLRLQEQRQLAAEAAERERNEEDKIADWLTSANASAEMRRRSYVRQKTKVEAGKVWPHVEPLAWVAIVGVGIATFPIGLLIAGVLFVLDQREKRERLRQVESDALRKYPDHSRAEIESLKAGSNWPPLAAPLLRCPKCKQRLNAPTGKHLRLKCPVCTHQWMQMT